MTWRADPLSHRVQHRDGVPWDKAPLPGRVHWCRPQTQAFVDGRWVERCACGATRVDGSWWFERNSR